MRPWSAAFVLFVCASPSLAQGRLEQARQEMDGAPAKPKDAPAAKPKEQAGDSTGAEPTLQCDDEDGGWGNLFGPLFLLTLEGIAAPLWLPAQLLHDNQHAGYFLGHPYASPTGHFIEIDPQTKQAPDLATSDPKRYKPWSVRLALEDGNDFRGLNRAGVRAAFGSAVRFGVTTNWDYFTERLACGCRDDAVMGDVNLVYRIAQGEWLQMHAGVGGRLWVDRYSTFGGVNATYGADFFPRQPVVVSTQIDLGNLGDAFVVRGRATVGWQINRLEVYGGYDYLRIGSVTFQGPMLGARLWF